MGDMGIVNVMQAMLLNVQTHKVLKVNWEHLRDVILITRQVVKKERNAKWLHFNTTAKARKDIVVYHLLEEQSMHISRKVSHVEWELRKIMANAGQTWNVYLAQGN